MVTCPLRLHGGTVSTIIDSHTPKPPERRRGDPSPGTRPAALGSTPGMAKSASRRQSLMQSPPARHRDPRPARRRYRHPRPAKAAALDDHDVARSVGHTTNASCLPCSRLCDAFSRSGGPTAGLISRAVPDDRCPFATESTQQRCRQSASRIVIVNLLAPNDQIPAIHGCARLHPVPRSPSHPITGDPLS